MRDGMNKFLKMVGITFRRDADTNRPRINKLDSRLDREQKSAGEYYYAIEMRFTRRDRPLRRSANQSALPLGDGLAVFDDCFSSEVHGSREAGFHSLERCPPAFVPAPVSP